MSTACDTPNEARAVIGAMVAHVREVDAQFFDRFGTEPIEEVPEWAGRENAAYEWNFADGQWPPRLCGRRFRSRV